MDAAALLSTLEWAVPVVLGVVLHEMAHGFAALRFGDPTARDAGRLTPNPLRHVDPVGTVLFPLTLVLSHSPFVFGWAKPVPVDFSRLKNPKRDMVWVAMAGPAMNFVLALAALAALGVMQNAAFSAASAVVRMLLNAVLFNFSLMTFNLIPVLPLDGGRILTGILPMRQAIRFARTEKYGFGVIALLLIFLPLLGDYTGRDFAFVSRFLAFSVQKLTYFFAGLFGLIQGEKGMSIGFFQLLVILLIVLVLFGRGKLPALAEDLGKSVSSFKKGLNEDKEPENKPAENDPSKDA